MQREDGNQRRTTYPLAAALLAAGAPLGYLALRAALSPSEPTAWWARHEIAEHAFVYGYLTLATLAVFVVLGRVLGRRADALAEASASDPLTRLWNRKHFAVRLAEEVARATRQQTPLSLMLVDIDGLKQVNDVWGHEGGDGTLMFLADALRRCCRKTDVCARIGGDEFAVLMPETEALAAAEQGSGLRAHLREIGARLITVSIGVADLERSKCVSARALLDAADRALCRAKALGKDRVELADLDRRRDAAPPPGAQVAVEGRRDMIGPRPLTASRWLPGALFVLASSSSCLPPLPPDSRFGDSAPAPVEEESAASIAVWSEEAYDPAERHLRHAAQNRAHAWEHERLAVRLAHFEEGSCAEFPETTRPLCPLFGEIDSVEETERGLAIEIASEVPVEAMLDHMRCHIDFAAASDGLAPSCPLYVPGVRVGLDSGALVLVGIDDEATAELQRRARRGSGF